MKKAKNDFSESEGSTRLEAFAWSFGIWSVFVFVAVVFLIVLALSTPQELLSSDNNINHLGVSIFLVGCSFMSWLVGIAILIDLFKPRFAGDILEDD